MGALHNVDNASINAFKTLSQTKKELNRKIVLDCISDNHLVSDREIADILGWKINSVTPRRNELVKLGEIISNGRVKTDSSNVKVNVWRLTTAEEKAKALQDYKLEELKIARKKKAKALIDARNSLKEYFLGLGIARPSKEQKKLFIDGFLIGKGV